MSVCDSMSLVRKKETPTSKTKVNSKWLRTCKKRKGATFRLRRRSRSSGRPAKRNIDDDTQTRVLLRAPQTAALTPGTTEEMAIKKCQRKTHQRCIDGEMTVCSNFQSARSVLTFSNQLRRERKRRRKVRNNAKKKRERPEG